MPICHIYNTHGEKLLSFDTDSFFGQITVGRSSKCQICLKGSADINISREQLVIRKQAGVWMVENIGNCGLYMNGTKIISAPINEDDVFRFAQLFLCIGEKNGPSPMELVWDFMTENNQHRAVIWPGVNTVGSSIDNYCTVRAGDISRIHGKLTYVNNRLLYEDMYKDVETEHNGVSVHGETVELRDGDELTLADMTVRVVKGYRARHSEAQIIEGKNVIASFFSSVSKHPLGWLAGILALILFLTVMFIVFASIWQILVP